jgi:phage gp29-like protein
MKSATLLDQFGNPVRRAVLTQEVAAATIGSVRSPISGYSGDGLTPNRLAGILREADAGDALRYLQLAETIEERDPHYLGVLGTRRRSVSQIEITVEAGSEDAQDEVIAQMVRDWLKRDELTDEIFNILDCIGKGYSMTEIIWDTSEGQWQPSRLEWRDPRWFRFARHDLNTPMMLSDSGEEVPLEPFKFVYANIKAKSGLPLRSGLSRVAMWGYLFKAFTLRDWAIFSQTYGQPVRVGKFDSNASKEDKATLFRAVANIAGDCAAIIPASMEIEFIESGNVGAAADLYEKRADWFDKQISNAVLGQTATTDAVTGGLGSGKEHREVQKDIETADAKALAAILNRDLIRPWVQLEFGQRKTYPRLKIEHAEQEDLKAFSEAVGPLIDRGLEVEQATVLSRFGLSEPKAGAKLLRPSRASAPASEGAPSNPEIKRDLDVFKRGKPVSGAEAQLQAEEASVGQKSGVSPEAVLADRMQAEADAPMAAIMAKIEAMVETAQSFDELRQMLLEGFPDIDASNLAQVLSLGLLAAHSGGRAAVVEDSQ